MFSIISYFFVKFGYDRENSNNSSSSGLGEGLDGRINLISDRDFRERNDALRIDTGNDKQGTGLKLRDFLFGNFKDLRIFIDSKLE